MFLSAFTLGNQLYWVTPIKAYDLVNPFPVPYTSCSLVGARKAAWARYIPILFLDTILLALTLYKFANYIQSGSKHMLPKVLFRDGFVGFIVVILATVFSIVICLTPIKSLWSIGQDLSLMVPVLVVGRMLLNLRDVMGISDNAIGSSVTTAPVKFTESYSLGDVMPQIVESP